MANLVRLREAIEKYSDEFRRSDIEKLVESKIYSLDKNVEIRSTSPALYWPDTWPLTDRRGIYAIFSHEKLLYIGKASQQDLGFRLSSYFRTVEGKCEIALGHTWSHLV